VIPAVNPSVYQVPLKMGGFYAVGRTTQGFLAAAYTAAKGAEHWPTPTSYANYFVHTGALL